MKQITPSRRTRDNLSKALAMPESQTPEFFESRSIPKLLLEFSAPAIVASLVTASYNLVARIFVAQRFGTDGVAAVTVSFPIILIFLAVAMTIGAGTTILISIRLGERKLDKAENVFNCLRGDSYFYNVWIAGRQSFIVNSVQVARSFLHIMITNNTFRFSKSRYLGRYVNLKVDIFYALGNQGS